MAAPVFVPAKTDYPLTVYADPEAVLNRPLSAAPHAKAGRTPLSPSKNGLPAYAPANKGKEKEMTKTLKVPAPNPLAGEHGLGAGEFGFLLPAPSGLLMGRSSAKSDDRPKRPKRSKNTVDCEPRYIGDVRSATEPHLFSLRQGEAARHRRRRGLVGVGALQPSLPAPLASI